MFYDILLRKKYYNILNFLFTKVTLHNAYSDGFPCFKIWNNYYLLLLLLLLFVITTFVDTCRQTGSVESLNIKCNLLKCYYISVKYFLNYNKMFDLTKKNLNLLFISSG